MTNLTLRRWANRYGMLEHALHKTMVGSYRRQSRTALFAGRDMRWFASSPALAIANRMVDEASGRRIRHWLTAATAAEPV